MYVILVWHIVQSGFGGNLNFTHRIRNVIASIINSSYASTLKKFGNFMQIWVLLLIFLLLKIRFLSKQMCSISFI